MSENQTANESTPVGPVPDFVIILDDVAPPAVPPVVHETVKPIINIVIDTANPSLDESSLQSLTTSLNATTMDIDLTLDDDDDEDAMEIVPVEVIQKPEVTESEAITTPATTTTAPAVVTEVTTVVVTPITTPAETVTTSASTTSVTTSAATPPVITTPATATTTPVTATTTPVTATSTPVTAGVIPADASSNTVIDLDDSDDSDSVIAIIPKTKKLFTDCINDDCTNGEDLKQTTGYCLSFYKVKYNPKRKQLICKECRDLCLNNYQIMADLLQNNENIFNHKLEIRNDCVEINDSDDEDEQNLKTGLEQSEENQLDEEINYILAKSFDKYNFNETVNIGRETVKTHLDTNEASLNEIDTILKNLQTKVDTLRNKIYERRPVLQSLPPLDILSDGPVQPLHFINKDTSVERRRSNRKISKQPTYDENADSTSMNTYDEDIITVEVSQHPANLPKSGVLEYEKPQINDSYYAMLSTTFSAWARCRLLEIYPVGCIVNDKAIEGLTYRVKFEEGKKKDMAKLVTGNQLAYTRCSEVRYPVGSRVIALFKEQNPDNYFAHYYAGIVAEPMLASNKYRYLIFFDDGYAQYVYHKNIYLISQKFKNVWEDVPAQSRDYIRNYLSEYPDRAMVRLTVGAPVRTEYNGKWWSAKVLRIDGSLVLMYFEADRRSEWIYRGSRRLGPLYKPNNANLKNNRGSMTPQRRLPPRDQYAPYVEYTRNIEPVDDVIVPAAPRAVARKSTGNTNLAIKSTTHNIVPFLPSTTPQVADRVVYYSAKAGKKPRNITRHICSKECKKFATRTLQEMKQYSILSYPVLSGWQRETARFTKTKREIRYVAPCGRALRSMPELHQYLRVTVSEMSVDMFDFNVCIHVLTLYTLDKTFVELKDYSCGQEQTPISCINDIDGTLPEEMRYTTQREPTEGVHLNVDEEFLCGCDCTDDCQDRDKCACWQLTMEGIKLGKHNHEDITAGYEYKRLLDPVVTGIYECNSRCKCNSTCLNRVVQHPLQLKLQIFKTANRGWGIRCLHDVPRGSFICIYAGELLTEQKANEGGKNFGDEYLAELDYIEVVERLKEGYEAEVPEEDLVDENEDSNSLPDEDDDEDYHTSEKSQEMDQDFICTLPKSATKIDSTIRTRLRRRNVEGSDSNQGSDSEKSDSKASSQEEKHKINYDSKMMPMEDDYVTISDDECVTHEPSSFVPTADAEDSPEEWEVKYKSVRQLFGSEETCYVMDAKNAGNIGRFLNHSCSPNVFVQNVFVDTHDLRFPWVAFFALSHVRAGIELTWNYNYDVGSVPDKVLYCHCGSDECRGRLL